MIIGVVSSKGGTGKTTVATNLALSIGGTHFIDCDVEGPDGNLFLCAQIETRWEAGIQIPMIDQVRCTLCGNCIRACERKALEVSMGRVLLFVDLCHGYGVCGYVCPQPGAITERFRRLGEIESGWVRCADARDIAYTGARLDMDTLLITPLIREINKYDVNLENSRAIRGYCAENQVPVVGEIPFSPGVRHALVARKSLVEFDCGAVSDIVEGMWSEIERKIGYDSIAQLSVS